MGCQGGDVYPYLHWSSRLRYTCSVYSPQGHQLASASYEDKTVRLWDMVSGECHHTLVGHQENINTIAYSPRGNLLVSWSDKGEANLWGVATGDCLWNLNHNGSTRPPTSYLSHPFVWMSDDSFTTGDRRGSVKAWNVVKEGDRHHVHMRWRPTNGELALEGACVQDVQGLSDINKRLLKQRGATGEPSLRLREAGTKVMAMTSVVSKLKSSSFNTEAPNSPSISPAIPFTKHLEQQTEQVMFTGTLEN